jgi:hypothetical protein
MRVPELRPARLPQPRRLLPPSFRHRARRSPPPLRRIPCARRRPAACATPLRPVATRRTATLPTPRASGRFGHVIRAEHQRQGIRGCENRASEPRSEHIRAVSPAYPSSPAASSQGRRLVRPSVPALRLFDRRRHHAGDRTGFMRLRVSQPAVPERAPTPPCSRRTWGRDGARRCSGISPRIHTKASAKPPISRAVRGGGCCLECRPGGVVAGVERHLDLDGVAGGLGESCCQPELLG